jgi:hypothetical protein
MAFWRVICPNLTVLVMVCPRMNIRPGESVTHPKAVLYSLIMTGFELIAGLERIINLMLLYPQGMSILLGLVPAPLSVEIVQAFPPKQFDHMGIKGMFIPDAERVVLDADRIDAIIKASGGWEHITRTIRQWKNENPADWALVADHISLHGSKLQRIADKYGISAQTVKRKRKAFAGILADYILFSPIEPPALSCEVCSLT